MAMSDDELRTGESDLSTALGRAVRGLYEKGSSSAKAVAIWGEAVGPVGVRHTRGIYVKESGRPDEPPTLFVYLDSNTFVYEYLTDRQLYEQRLAYLGFPVKELVPKLSRSAGEPAPKGPLDPVSQLAIDRPKAQPLDELEPLDAKREEWARRSVASLPEGLADAVYDAMTSTMRRNQAEGR